MFLTFALLDSDLISIGRTTGIIEVQPIDRDKMKIEFYPFEARKLPAVIYDEYL